MRTQADENYLKEIYTLGLDNGQVTTSMLADRFGFSSATVTGMLKKLARCRWVSYEPYQGVTLTETGREIALEVIRHHRLIETYLAQALNIPWDRVHSEAEKLEHAISEYLENRIDEALDHPSFDPHGSPIPSPSGRMDVQSRLRLSKLSKGTIAEIVEVNDRDPLLLAHLAQLNLRPGTCLLVVDLEPFDELITVHVNEQTHVLGCNTANQIIVKILTMASHTP